ncbi:hypothetical protein D4764_03G0009290 [Takifugu flavidus]|uniref:Uncharacterized protein n=1 Tax=Takifugu flavidus TaxID=433684 RepID=A0A5C6NBU7_9TELE|nr:hypothetical protein D4764_03G0009290 [Takifugu flavidus]
MVYLGVQEFQDMVNQVFQVLKVTKGILVSLDFQEQREIKVMQVFPVSLASLDKVVCLDYQVFQENQAYQEWMGNQDQGVFRGRLAPKVNMVLGVYQVPLVVEDHLVYEERWGNQEREVTKGHKVYQDFQDLGDQLGLLGCLGKKAKLAFLVDLATLERENQDSLAMWALKVARGKPVPPDFQGHRDFQDHQGLQDFLLHLPIADKFFQRLAQTAARSKST